MSCLQAQLETIRSAMLMRITGKVRAINGLTIEASDLPLPLGATCRISSPGGRSHLAEVIGFEADGTLLMSLGTMDGVSRGDPVESVAGAGRFTCSSAVLGRVLDGFGSPIDGRGPVAIARTRPAFTTSTDAGRTAAMRRTSALATGIRAVDALLTCGSGQRMGIFAGPGVGKSTLLSSIARHGSADVSVIALIGERRREVQEFIDESLGDEGLRRSVVIVCTGDEAPLLRIRAARLACTIAEYFRDRGEQVLLLMDSLTRLCHGQRQVALAAREMPATRGYPPSVFALLPQILERAGRSTRSELAGAITGFYTVLTEGDHVEEDPIADAVKGIVDGQIRLRASLANSGHYPAIDILQSMSRLRDGVVDPAHLAAARRVVALLAGYGKIEEMVNIGAYVRGANPEFDLAVLARPKIMAFLQQDCSKRIDLAQSRRELLELSQWIDQAAAKLSADEK